MLNFILAAVLHPFYMIDVMYYYNPSCNLILCNCAQTVFKCRILLRFKVELLNSPFFKSANFRDSVTSRQPTFRPQFRAVSLSWCWFVRCIIIGAKTPAVGLPPGCPHCYFSPKVLANNCPHLWIMFINVFAQTPDMVRSWIVVCWSFFRVDL